MGETEAAEVMKFLGPREVLKLGAAMATMKNVPHEDVVGTLDNFRDMVAAASTVGLDSDEYIRQVLTKALGDDKASVLLSRILGGKDASGIESLKWMDSQSVAELIRNEHPQIIATILVHLERDQACEILGHFTDRLRNDVVLRIATLDGVQPAALRELNDVLTKLLSGNENIKKSTLGGVRTAAEILNFMSGEQEGSVMDNIKNYDNDMAQKIMDEMFVFDNVIDIDDRGIQLLLREVQSDMLIIALKGASQELRDKIFKNMSARAAEMMREDLESKGPVRLSEVEAQQKAYCRSCAVWPTKARLCSVVKATIPSSDEQYGKNTPAGLPALGNDLVRRRAPQRRGQTRGRAAPARRRSGAARGRAARTGRTGTAGARAEDMGPPCRHHRAIPRWRNWKPSANRRARKAMKKAIRPAMPTVMPRPCKPASSAPKPCWPNCARWPKASARPCSRPTS
jgi:flagellar motor switch protein FliG